MNANKHLIFGVNIGGIKHPLRFKWYDDEVILAKTICDWLPVIMLRANSGGVNAGYEVSDLPKFSNGVHIAYWYDTSMFYYVEVVEELEDNFFCPSPAVAPFFDELDKAPATLTQAQAFNNLWEAIRERERIEAQARTAEQAIDYARIKAHEEYRNKGMYRRR